MAAELDREQALDRVHAVKGEIASDFMFGLRLAAEIDPAGLSRLLADTPIVRKLTAVEPPVAAGRARILSVRSRPSRKGR